MSEKSATAPTGRTLTTGTLVAYGLPRSGSAMIFVMVAVYLSKFYTDTLLLAPAFVAWTFLIGRFWDGLTDPIMGYVSDATRTRMGRRRPYFLLSAIPVAIAYFYLWIYLGQGRADGLCDRVRPGLRARVLSRQFWASAGVDTDAERPLLISGGDPRDGFSWRGTDQARSALFLFSLVR